MEGFCEERKLLANIEIGVDSVPRAPFFSLSYGVTGACPSARASLETAVISAEQGTRLRMKRTVWLGLRYRKKGGACSGALGHRGHNGSSGSFASEWKP